MRRWTQTEKIRLIEWIKADKSLGDIIAGKYFPNWSEHSIQAKVTRYPFGEERYPNLF